MPGLPHTCHGLFVLLAAAALPACRSVPADDLEFRRGQVTNGRLTIPYAVYVPRGFSITRRWPVILYLHGFSERGDDGSAPLRAGIGPVLRQHPDRFPCLIVIPQAPRSRLRWERDVNELALEALEAVVRQYHGDRRRLYLSGVSMGGAGC